MTNSALGSSRRGPPHPANVGWDPVALPLQPGAPSAQQVTVSSIAIAADALRDVPLIAMQRVETTRGHSIRLTRAGAASALINGQIGVDEADQPQAITHPLASQRKASGG
jgi:hypothetical protein